MERLRICIEALIHQNKRHRKGFYIKDATPTLACSNLVEEAGELLVAMELNRIQQTREEFASELVLEELADVAAVFVHLTILLNVSFEDLTTAALIKLDKRFQ